MNELRLKSYANLLMKTGLNLKKGQTIVITSPVDCADFARICVSAAYDCGCRDVIMNWIDDKISREHYLRADDAVFDEYPDWKAGFYNSSADNKFAWLRIDADDPESLSGVDPLRLSRASRASASKIKNFRDKQMSSYFPWCVAAASSPGWAKKVFPNMSENDAVEALWDAILDSVRVWENGDPVREWDNHISTLRSRVDTLNRYNFKYLKYKNSVGTDLTVELPDGHYWEGGNEQDSSGTYFCANMPTEEIFTVPKRDGVNGTVTSSKPLSLNGHIVSGFTLTFKDGKITHIEAEKGAELLRAEVSLDEGASYLGEVALVPYNSPISNSGILFYNTLFDENASCHFAFGDAYPLIKGGKEMTDEQRKAAGVNSSITHTDFMVGTKDLSITGITHDGKEIPVFIDGNFAF